MANGKRCTIPAGPQDYSTWPAQATWWPIQQGMNVPFLPSYVGPQYMTTGGIPYCFAHSPMGAAFAAMHTIAGLMNQQARVANDTLKLRLTGPGLGKSQVLARSTRQYLALKFLGFQIGPHDQNRVVVSIGMIFGDQKTFAGMLEMRWVNNDWLAYAPDDPDTFLTLSDQSTFLGYTTWLDTGSLAGGSG